MTVLAGPYDFTGSDTDPWPSGWTQSASATGSSATIQSNRGRLDPGTLTGGSGKHAMRWTGGTADDIEITGTFNFPVAGSQRIELWIRALNTSDDGDTGYFAQIFHDGSVKIFKAVSYSYTQIGSTYSATFTTGTDYDVRFRVVGTSLQITTWESSGSEGSWHIDETDSSITAAGYVHFHVQGGSSASKYVEFDDVTLTDGAGSSEIDLDNDTASFSESLSIEATPPDMEEGVSFSEDFSISIAPDMSGESAQFTESLSIEVFQNRHDLVVEIEQTSGIWTDVSEYTVAEVASTGTFGRPTRFDDVASATWTVNLRNSDGRFTPPNLKKGMRIRVGVTYAGQEYRRFWGKIVGLVMPAFSDVEQAEMQVQAADIMSDLARRTLASPFVEESRRQAASASSGADVFVFTPTEVKSETSSDIANTSFENKGILFSSSTTLGTVSVIPAANNGGDVDSSTSGSGTGLQSEGAIDFKIGDNGEGRQTHPVISVYPQVGFRQVELLFSIPDGVLPPLYSDDTYTVQAGDNWYDVAAVYGNTFDQLRKLNPDLPGLSALATGQVVNVASTTAESEWVVAHFWSGSTEMFRVCFIDYEGKVVMTARHSNGGVAYITDQQVNLADGKWHKLTCYRSGDDAVNFNVDDSPIGGPLTSLDADITETDRVFIGGRTDPTDQAGQQIQCGEFGVGGLAFQESRVGVWYWYCIGAPPANVTAQERLIELAQYASFSGSIDIAVDTAWDSALDRPFDVKVVRTDITGRSILDCMQELARTVSAYLWVQPEDGTLTMRRGPNPPSSQFSLDLELDADVSNPLEWRDTIDNQPTRITATCPAGQATSINTAAEAAGQYKDGTIDTCAATVAVAKAVADRYVAGQSTLHLTNLQIDLVHSANPLHGQILPVFLPTERVVRATSVPSDIIGYDTVDSVIESWTESYTADSATFTFETTPIRTFITPPQLSELTVTASTGIQDGAEIAADQPAGVTSGDLLVAILTTDDTGSLGGMSAPAGWSAQGSGSTSDAGAGMVWSKTAGADEAEQYVFSVAATQGTAILMTDAFTGSNGAAWDTDDWDTGQATTGATAEIQSNTGELDPGSLTDYAGRASMIADIDDKADVDLAFSFKQSNNDCYLLAMLRGDSGGEGTGGYQLRTNVGTAAVTIWSITGEYDQIGSIETTITTGTWYRIRFQVIGSTVRAKIWTASQTEPAAWGSTVTDTSITAAGTVYIAAAGGAISGSIIYIDDVVVSDPHAVTSIPEADLTVLRVAGADTSDPFITSPTWADDGTATTSHDAPTVSPANAGLLVSHWHILTEGAGTGGGGGGPTGAFSFGMSGWSGTDPTAVKAQIDAGSAWLTNGDIDAIAHWADNSSSVQEEQYGFGASESYGLWTGIADVAIGGIFGSETWANAASGAYDSRITTAIQNLASKWGSRPPGNMHIRPAHEFNGDWYSWAVYPSDASNFVSAWQRWADIIRAEFPGAQIVWSPNDGTSSGLATMENTWPGASYVDLIGPDTYNQYPHVTNATEWAAKIEDTDGSGNPVGIETWRQWAYDKGKPLCIPEWGDPAHDNGGGAGGGDDPYYAQAFLDWCKAHGGYGAGQVKYAIYFNIGILGGYSGDFLVWGGPNGIFGTVNQPNTAAIVRGNG